MTEITVYCVDSVELSEVIETGSTVRVTQVKTKDHAQTCGRGAERGYAGLEFSNLKDLYCEKQHKAREGALSGGSDLSPNSSPASKASSHLRKSLPLSELCFLHQEKSGGWTR